MNKRKRNLTELSHDDGFCHRQKRHRRRANNRRGAAAVEFAIVAPVFILLILGAVEISRMFMVQHMLVNASREGARNAVVGESTTTSVETAVTDFLKDNGITTATVTVTPDPATAPNGQPISVTVSVPFNDVTWLPTPQFLGGKLLTSTARMRREGPG